MTTTAAGGKITGLLALTCDAAAGVTLAVGDWVEITANYTVNKQTTGTKPLLGVVTVGNVKRLGGAYPVANPGGQVTVDVPGFMVRTVKSAGAVTVGTRVGIAQATQKLAAAGAGVANIGIALTSASAVDQDVDVLVQGF
jgi:hypothetical protein